MSRRKGFRRHVKALSLAMLKRLPRTARDLIILSGIRPDADSLTQVTIKIASTPEEHEQASRLLFDAYVQTGITNDRGVPVRLTPFLILPTTIRFVALVEGEVVGTLSLVQDSPLGLPIDSVYRNEMAELRQKGERIAEIGSLAIKREHRRQGLVMLMYKAMWLAAARLLDVKHLVAAVHPDVGMFYEAVLRFVPLSGSATQYPGLADAPACALHLPLETTRPVYERAFGRLPRFLFNPLRFFDETTHPQIALPTTKEELEALRREHKRAAIRLAWLRPDVVLSLDPSEAKVIEEALSGAA